MGEDQQLMMLSHSGNLMKTCDIYNFQYSGGVFTDFCGDGTGGTKYSSIDLSKEFATTVTLGRLTH